MRARERLLVGWLTLFVIGTDLFVVSPLLPPIAGEFRLSASAAGLCATAFSVCYMVGAPLFGSLADRLGRRRILTACLASFALANGLTGAATDFGWLIVWRSLAGAAAAGVTPLIYAGIGDEAPPARRATWLALAVSGLLLALSIGAPAGALIGARWGWRAPFLVIAGLSLLLVAANRLAWPPASSLEGAPADAGPARRLSALRLAPTVLWATALYGMYTYLGLGLTAAGFSPHQIARTIALYGAAALIGTLLGGRVADRVGTRKTMLASVTGLAICLALLAISLDREWSVDLAVIAASIAAQLFFPAQQAALAADFPGRRATVLAWNNSALFLGISLGALIGGQTMNRAGFASTALCGAGLACLAYLVVASQQKAQITTKTLHNIDTAPR